MPKSEFHSREEVLAGTNKWASHQGYAVVIARSRPNRLWIKCDRGGKYENRRNLVPDARKRKRGESRLLGCPFKVLASLKKDGVWRVEVDNAEHNHGPSDDLSLHPSLRRMTEEQVKKVQEMCDAGQSPADTVDGLRAIWPDINVLPRDVYNARKKYKSERQLEEGQPEQEPYPDPNGVFPGPSENGRWAWVPDGEEVTNSKKKRKRRRFKTPAPATLDPRLQTPEASQMAIQSMSPTAQRNLSNYTSSLTHSPYPAPSILRDYAPATTDGASDLPSTSPSWARSPVPDPASTSDPPTVATAVMTPNPPQAETGAKPLNGQVLMSRIERMEKEQLDTKNMLSQILGAVQGKV